MGTSIIRDVILTPCDLLRARRVAEDTAKIRKRSLDDIRRPICAPRGVGKVRNLRDRRFDLDRVPGGGGRSSASALKQRRCAMLRAQPGLWRIGFVVASDYLCRMESGKARLAPGQAVR